MSIHAALTHRTSYRYERPVSLGPQTIRLRPAPSARTPILAYTLKVEPEPHFLNWQQDPQGNFLARVVFPERVSHFDVTVDLIADVATINPFDFFLEPAAETFPFAYDPLLAEELAPFRKCNESGPLLAALIAEARARVAGEGRTIDLLVALNRAVQARIGYIVRLEPGVWEPEQTLAEARGSCRDSAWLLVQLLRHLGFAARFCSGYLVQLVADIRPLVGPEGPTADFADLHAWAEVYLPGAGWIGLDATSGLFAGEGHIPLASTPAPQSAAPISGLVEKAATHFDVTMAIRRIAETPRVTKPVPDRAWQDILAAGRRVDRALETGGVRLTMGGEPTFVAAADFEAPEWNTEALGPTKRAYAGRLIRRLASLWAPGCVLHHGQGKQYPSESLPRWALTCLWRHDGEALWHDASLLADPDADRTDADATLAARFGAALAERLQVDPALLRPAHEDAHYYLWREHRLPANVIVEDNKLRDPLERARMARVFAQGLAAPVGCVLPLRRVWLNGARRWQSARWFCRDDTLFLVPGDNAIGLRLPLDSLPWVDPATIEDVFEPDPLAPRDALPPPPASQRRIAAAASGEGDRRVAQDLPVVGTADPALVRTALCVEPRDGLLHVFLPPLTAAEDWLDLIAAIEATAAEVAGPVVIEGYLPPDDDRLGRFSVTPDPGVIEVNVHPARDWPEMVERTERLYEVARDVGLATEKFMLDGSHVGTGGGNHVVMGAMATQNSPFLRRPDLLKSLLGFWHNHPSLSFLFSGMFIGPTSQHPRVDEARNDALRELEIAFSRVTPFASTPPWLTDRLFRNILADMTGNTHRTEFCIDKLFDPASAAGRRGLVEFRAFEMPPHARMAAAQLLLLRSAIAAFWQTPYERRLVRWGTRLHDDFLLPSCCEADFHDALEELGLLGFPLERTWFDAHLAFRFPAIGKVAIGPVELAVRHALEPWHVLGEEQIAGGTARYVDSSTQRLEVRVAGFSAERYVVACNGCAVPLSTLETAGAYAGGVRFKAWAPPSALHPTIGAQTPLVFDLWDRWSGRSLGGLTYHAVHPGGRSYETFPVNANEAEARRRARFFAFGHTPGPMPEPRASVDHEHPRTLDLRRFA